MPAPSPSWNLVRVYGTWRGQDGSLRAGSYKVTIPARITNATDDAIIPAGIYKEGVLQTAVDASPSLDVMVPATDDPDNLETGWKVRVEVKFTDGAATENYQIDVPVGSAGVNLRTIVLSPNPVQQAAQLKVGLAGGLATLDADGAVVDAFGVKVGTGGGAVDSVAGRDGDVVLSLADIVGLTTALGGKAPNDSPTFTGTVTGITKAMVGLGNVDNTSDAAKPVSTAQAAALAAKADLVGGKIPTAQIPAVALGTAVPVANQAAMLALTAAQVQPGDVAVRADGAGTFMLMADDPSVLGNWRLLNAPADAVSSVNGQTGTIVLGKADVGLGNVDNTSDVNKPVSTATQTALNGKMATSALTSMRLSWAAANALSARPTLPAGVPFSIYGATAAQAATPPSWLIDGDWIDVRS